MQRGPYHGLVGRKDGRQPQPKRANAVERVEPVTIQERIRWKVAEVLKWQRKIKNHPNDRCYPLVLERVKDELEQLKALRDGRTWRRNG